MVERAEEIYQALLDAGISEEELNFQIKEKEIQFQGFMTKQAILFLIAKENGIDVVSSENIEILNHITEDLIDYNDFAIPISNINENMRNIVITGRITEIFKKRDFVKKDGTPGRVGSFQICDKSECIKIVLWNDQTSIMENGFFQKDEIIQIIGGFCKRGINDTLEIHLSRQGKLVLAPEGVVLQKEENYGNKSLSEYKKIKKSLKFSIKELQKKEGFIQFVKGKIQIGDFKELTLQNGEKSFLLKLILSDETASIKVNIWGMKAVDLIKFVKDGDLVKLSNVVLKVNSYSNEKELNFTKITTLQII